MTKCNRFLCVLTIITGVLIAFPLRYGGSQASMTMTVYDWEPSLVGKTAAVASAMWEGEVRRSWLLVISPSESKTENIGVMENAGEPSYSPSSDCLAYVHNINRVAFPPGDSDTRISLFLPESKAAYDLTTGFADQQPVWSSSGSALAFSRILRDRRGMQVYTIARKGDCSFDSANPIGGIHTTISGLTWRPAYNELAYVTTKLEFDNLDRGTGQTRSFNVILAGVEGGAQMITTTGDVGPKYLSWSPDGRCLAYVRETPYLANKPGSGGKFTKLVVVQPANKEYRELVTASQLGSTSLSVGSLRWSPDRRQILFDVLTLDKKANTDIALVEWPDGKFRWLTRDGKSKLPRWSSDGWTIMYVHADSEIWSVNVDGSRNQKVYDLEY